MNEPFTQAVPIITKIEEAGFEAYFVGGSVRDQLLGRPVSDIDIASSATPAEIKLIFPKTADVGIEHGTVLVLYGGASYEVTTFRAESQYTDFRRPDRVEFIRSLKEDLRRRDFSMNAMAMDRHGYIIDPYDGRVAINNKQIVTVGAPEERFREDALRILRALRFVSQLSFSIESRTLSSIKKLSGLLEKIAVERKTAEFEKMLTGPARERAMRLTSETAVYRYLPGLSQQYASFLQFASYKTSHLDVEEMWALLIYSLNLSGKGAEQFLREWKLPVNRIKKLLKIVRWLQYRMEHDWDLQALYECGIETALNTERVFNTIFQGRGNHESHLIGLFDSLPIKERSEVNVTGSDLMEWKNNKAGPWIKEMREQIEKAIIAGELDNHKQQIREWVGKCNRNCEEN
ncbi:CCA tRNA nucleotidyltransferase [Bacillus sp. T33-2]|uniref:CCA tRNA nucleotidyltransferase n=1 Tax=Bacillus sp. T33-2 TaxID=2054168 RepID=UPI000C77CEF2|nr:CCA tRNA nucleotidyltransferase [Bacillus sp. T33-2]PLR99723.1 CCA tRNA nucleotidyltransferase [Bacillus sp. T33-2]